MRVCVCVCVCVHTHIHTHTHRCARERRGTDPTLGLLVYLFIYLFIYVFIYLGARERGGTDTVGLQRHGQ